MMEISVIIPTFNEKDNLCYLLDSIGSLEAAGIKEILVIDAPDSADQLSLHYANSSIRILQAPLSGRASQMNYGASQATGQILYFVHADVKLPSGFAEKIIFEIKKGCFAGCFTYLFDSPSLLLKINAWFTHLPFLWCRGGDQSLFITKPLFEQVGGFNENQIIMEDYEIILRLKKILLSQSSTPLTWWFRQENI
jgi:glycosyltransferase involved in cell wall biosynthesis